MQITNRSEISRIIAYHMIVGGTISELVSRLNSWMGRSFAMVWIDILIWGDIFQSFNILCISHITSHFLNLYLFLYLFSLIFFTESKTNLYAQVKKTILDHLTFFWFIFCTWRIYHKANKMFKDKHNQHGSDVMA